jgi:ferrochelatase
MENAFQWSVIDRWPTNPGFVGEISKFIQEGLETYSKEERSRVLILFSAHSLPLAVVNRGDPYPQEVSASVQAVMEDLNFSHEFLVCYQSSVGPVQWMGPSTENMVRWLGRQNRQEVLVVPIAFSCDHIETIHEIDIEIKEIAEKSGVSRFRRIQSLNASPGFVKTLADIVNQHLKTGEICSTQYGLRCPGCSNQECRNVLNPIARRHK